MWEETNINVVITAVFMRQVMIKPKSLAASASTNTPMNANAVKNLRVY